MKGDHRSSAGFGELMTGESKGPKGAVSDKQVTEKVVRMMGV